MNYAMEQFTGVRPTAGLTAANYIGALKPIIDSESAGSQTESAVFVADIHAATTANPWEVADHSRELIRTLIASDYEGEIYTQWSIEDLVAQTEYALRGLTTVARLLRLPTLKDKVGQSEDVETAPVSLAMYPMMMAADIVLARAEYVPTGKDQQPHLEITRELIRAHNRKFGTELPVPKNRNVEPVNIGSLSGNGNKMSKTEPKGAIFLDRPAEEAKKKIMKAATAPAPGDEMDASINNLLEIARGLSEVADSKLVELADLADEVKEGKPRAKELKEAVAETVGKFVTSLQDRRNSVSDADIAERSQRGHEWIRPIATETLTAMKNAQRRSR